MEHQHPEEDLKNIAKQLACPEGEHGIKTGEMMHANNIGMTSAAIEALHLKNNDTVLEIGHGNGAHIAQLLSKAENLKYFGADISTTMIAEAEKINHDFINEGKVEFMLTDGNHLPFDHNQFDKIFTVNTIYFWSAPIQYLKQIKDVLKPNGLFALCFADKAFMEKLPFTLYTPQTVKSLLESAGFKTENTIEKLEHVQSKTGERVERKYYILVASAA